MNIVDRHHHRSATLIHCNPRTIHSRPESELHQLIRPPLQVSVICGRQTAAFLNIQKYNSAVGKSLGLRGMCRLPRIHDSVASRARAIRTDSQKLKQDAKATGDTMQQTASDAADATQKAASKAADKTKAATSDAVDATKKAAAETSEYMKEAADKAAKEAKKAADKAKQAAKDAANKANQ
jgi:gas vesicle protein